MRRTRVPEFSADQFRNRNMPRRHKPAHIPEVVVIILRQSPRNSVGPKVRRAVAGAAQVGWPALASQLF